MAIIPLRFRARVLSCRRLRFNRRLAKFFCTPLLPLKLHAFWGKRGVKGYLVSRLWKRKHARDESACPET